MKSFKNFVTEMDASMMTTLKQQGINAHRDGHPEHKNPYSKGSHEHSEWEKGWHESNAEKNKNSKKTEPIKSPFAFTDSKGIHHPKGSIYK